MGSSNVHQIVIIGASFGGLPVAQQLLKTVLPTVSAASKQKYKVVIIAPNDYFYFKIGAPRMLVNPDKFPVEKGLIPITDSFKHYGKDKFDFVHAYATSIDPATRTISTSTNQNVRYDSLIIASGTSFNSSAWSTSNGIDALRAELADFHANIPLAKSILVAGGGPVGIETSGELGDSYGGKKEITLLSGAGQLLSRLNNKELGQEAAVKLNKVGVKVVHNVKVNQSTKHADGKTTVKLSDGTEKTVDVYIEATGDRPNNSYVPQDWLNEKGFVKTAGDTLRLNVSGQHNVYCIGSVGSYSDGSIMDTRFGIKALLDSVKTDLIGKGESSASSIASQQSTTDPLGWMDWLISWIPYYGTAGAPKKPILYKKPPETQMVPIGAKAGVGVGWGWKLPAFVVVNFKSKKFFISDPPKVVNGTW